MPRLISVRVGSIGRGNLVSGTDEPTLTTTGLLPGYSVGSGLTSYTGVTTVTTNGTVIADKIIDVYLDIRASGVSISNCLFRGPSTAATSGKALLNLDSMPLGGDCLIADCEFAPQAPSLYLNAVQGHDFTARRLKLHDCVDFFSIRNPSNQTAVLSFDVQQCLWYDHSYFSPDPNHAGDAGDPPSGQTHNDGIQLQGGDGTGSIIKGNSGHGVYSATSGSGNAPDRGTGTEATGRYNTGSLKVIQWTNLSGYTTNVTVTDNWLYGGGRTINAGSANNTDIGSILRNRFDDAQGERSSATTPGTGHTIDMDPTTTCVTGDGTADANYYMQGTPGITFKTEVTVRRNQ